MDSLTIRTASVVVDAIEAAGETQLSVSDESGIPRATLIRRLKAQSAFTVTELEAIAPIIGVTVSEILTRAECVADGQPEAVSA